MIRKLLIANRGEVAIRIARTCQELGIATVAVYPAEDAENLHVTTADESVRVESYLNIASIVAAAKLSGADAVHPGFGFLSENAEFAQAVLDAGLTWIGPSPAAIAAMGDKRNAKLTLKDIPLILGYSGEDQSDEALTAAAKEIGLPVLVKASAGGGGKGMRRVDKLEDLPEALESARREAGRAFGNEMLILEKYLTGARHIEIQILGDTFGNVVALGERECTIQRRHQKIIEECPSPAVRDKLRQSMSEVAIGIGKQLKYTSAGTVEFLLDASGDFYFIEMNTRLQVEHPVTEMVYGVDLVALQIQIAEGRNITRVLRDVSTEPNGHAIEVRVYAEDPANDFLPSIGKVLLWRQPDGAGNRVEAGIETNSRITMNYDPMVAKIIAHAPTRDGAIRRLDYALSQTALLGVRNNIPFLRRVLAHPEFDSGDFDTGFLERNPQLAQPTDALPDHAIIGAALSKQPKVLEGKERGRAIRNQFRAGDITVETLVQTKKHETYTVTVGGVAHEVTYGDKSGMLIVDGHAVQTFTRRDEDIHWVFVAGEVFVLEWIDPLPVGIAKTDSAGSLKAPMTGKVISVSVEIEQSVLIGDILIVIEAMKMEHRITAPYDGTVKAIHCVPGQIVQQGVTLLDLQASNPS